MCGILGVCFAQKAEEAIVANVPKALGTLEKRGPDNRSVFRTDRAVLAHTRLSIIDTTDGANQPMTDASGRYTIIFNGEIYNYKELREELSMAGFSFSTQSDTEVLLNAYIHFGRKCLNRLNGFFAFGIYDTQTEELFAARDRFGIKPLLYAATADRLIFASDLHPFKILGCTSEINRQALHTYFRLSYIPAPATIFTEVKKLEPGECLFWSGGNLEIQKYYQPTSTTWTGSYSAAMEELRHLLELSVQDRLVADVPLGTFLSGGLDSSAITTIASRHRNQMPVFSIGFPDNGYFDETRYAAQLATQLGARHEVCNVDSGMLRSRLETILHSFDEPFADSSAVPFSILSEFTRGEVKVALSGDGADELFGGYHKHRALLAASRNDFSNRLLRTGGGLLSPLKGSRHGVISNKIRQLSRYSQGLSLSAKARYWEWATFASAGEVQALLNSEENLADSRMEEFTSGLTADFNSILSSDINLVLPNDMLKKVDLMSMNHGLEVRVPFLDHRLVEFASSLPAHYKISRNTGKKILRQAFADQLPKAVLKRPKRGFEVPMASWLRHELKPWLDRYLDAEFVRRQGIFDYTYLQNMRREILVSSNAHTAYLLWAVLVFQGWYTRFIDNDFHC